MNQLKEATPAVMLKDAKVQIEILCYTIDRCGLLHAGKF